MRNGCFRRLLRPEVQPLTLLYTFFHYPFHIPYSELCILFNCCHMKLFDNKRSLIFPVVTPSVDLGQNIRKNCSFSFRYLSVWRFMTSYLRNSKITPWRTASTASPVIWNDRLRNTKQRSRWQNQRDLASEVPKNATCKSRVFGGHIY